MLKHSPPPKIFLPFVAEWRQYALKQASDILCMTKWHGVRSQGVMWMMLLRLVFYGDGLTPSATACGPTENTTMEGPA